MARDGECWLKKTPKKTKKKHTDRTLIQMGNASNGLKTKRNFLEDAYEWQMDSVSATLHSGWVVFKEYITAFSHECID